MNVTNDGFKDRQLHMEDYLQMVPAEQGEYAEVSVYQRITENNDIITDFWTDNHGIRIVIMILLCCCSGISDIMNDDIFNII